MATKYVYLNVTFNAKQFSFDLRQWLTQSELTVGDMAELVSLSAPTIQSYMSGTEYNMHMQNFLRVCNVMDKDPAIYLHYGDITPF